jgi:hypothetical protein
MSLYLRRVIAVAREAAKAVPPESDRRNGNQLLLFEEENKPSG